MGSPLNGSMLGFHRKFLCASAACILVLCFSFATRAFGQTAASGNFDQLAERASEAWKAHQLDEAAKLYRQAVRLRPSWKEGWGYLASANFQQGDFSEARDAYRHTTVLTPKNGPSWALLGLCEYELRDYRDAFAHMVKGRDFGLNGDKSLTLDVAYHMSLLWTTAGKFELGMKEISVFSEVNDDSPPIIEATGLSVLRIPLFPYEIPPTKHDMVILAGQAAWDQNAHHLDDARKLYEKLAATYPKEPNVHYAYGMFLTTSLNEESAVKELEEELQITPGHVPALIEAAFLSLKLGDMEKSEAFARRAIQVEPKNYAPHNILGRILVEQGKLAPGIAELRLAAKLAPEIPVTHFSLAQAYQRAGQKSEASAEFAMFEKLNKQDASKVPAQ
jgi:tetratricopeptide (TPR) repeat protein